MMHVIQYFIFGFLCFGFGAHSGAQEDFDFPHDAFEAWEEVDRELNRKGFAYLRDFNVVNKGFDYTFNRKNVTESIVWTAKFYGDHILAMGQPKPDDTSGFLSTVKCINEEYGFELSKFNEGENWKVTKLLKDSDLERSELSEELRESINRPSILLFFMSKWPMDLVDLLSSDSFQLNEVVTEGTNSRRTVKVTFSVVNRNSNGQIPLPPIEHGEFIFDPHKNWAPISWRFETTGGQSSGKNSNFKRFGSIHVPMKQVWVDDFPSADIDRVREYVFSHIRIGASASHEFGLGAFGLPEISDNLKRKIPWARYGIIIFAIFLVCAGFWLRRRE